MICCLHDQERLQSSAQLAGQENLMEALTLATMLQVHMLSAR